MKSATQFIKRMALVTGLATLAGCQQPTADDVEGALPNDESVTLRVPGSAEGSGLQQPLLGEVSDFYVQTYRISRSINGHVLALLHVMRDITRHEPTRTEGDKYTWGPHVPGGLEPLAFRFTAEKTGERKYSVSLDARPKNSTNDADFRAIVDGQVEGSGEEDGRGRGHLVIHYDNWGSMNPAIVERGETAITYDSMVQPRIIEVDFIAFAGNGETPRDATYRYAEAEDRAGTFLFSIQANVHKPEDNLPGLETWTLRSRWNATGAGRGDVTISGAEVTAQLSQVGLSDTAVRATECWAEDMTVVFQDTLPEQLREYIRPLQGEAAACVVPAADFPEPM